MAGSAEARRAEDDAWAAGGHVPEIWQFRAGEIGKPAENRQKRRPTQDHPVKI
jgi:hypothetical protein